MNFSKDRKKNTSTSSGLGLAAAAIGVGVGAALYYFCTRQSENPNGQGSTSNWTCEQPRTFRERSWSLEQCSICFEVMLMDQNLITLACTHNFHSACIEPWLQEQKTCPYCRKPTE